MAALCLSGSQQKVMADVSGTDPYLRGRFSWQFSKNKTVSMDATASQEVALDHKGSVSFSQFSNPKDIKHICKVNT